MVKMIIELETKNLHCCGNCQYYTFETESYICLNTGRSMLPFQKCVGWAHRSKDRDLTSAEICQIVGELRKESEMDSLPEDLIFSKIREYSTATTDEQIIDALEKDYYSLRGPYPVWVYCP